MDVYEILENSIIKNDDLQKFQEYKHHWFSKNKKKVRTISLFNVKYHMIDDFCKIVKKPAKIPKDIRVNRKNNLIARY
ncbi:MAG: hypothetical protein R3Y09_09175 [Clostridia bacterium]